MQTICIKKEREKIGWNLEGKGRIGLGAAVARDKEQKKAAIDKVCVSVGWCLLVLWFKLECKL